MSASFGLEGYSCEGFGILFTPFLGVSKYITGGGGGSRDNISVALFNSSLVDNWVIKHSCSDGKYIILSKNRFKRSVVDSDIESRLLQYSGDVSDVLRGDPDYRHDAKRRDDTPVPVELWMYWLNTGIRTCLTMKQWDQHVIVVQEIVFVS